jgi:hypothetical protein
MGHIGPMKLENDKLCSAGADELILRQAQDDGVSHADVSQGDAYLCRGLILRQAQDDGVSHADVLQGDAYLCRGLILRQAQDDRGEGRGRRNL